MDVSNTSPNTFNYAVLKGIVKFQKTGTGSYRDLGNVPEFELTPTVDKLDHFSSRTGVRSKDRSIVREKSLTIRIVMDEITADNLGMALMGAVTASSPEYVVDVFTLSEITGAVRFVGTNDVGARVQMDLPTVSITPSSSINFISEEWASIEVTGEVLADVNGSFGQ